MSQQKAWQDRVAGTFRERFDDYPEIIVRSPGRVNLMGDHTDYNEGFVLPIAIESATWVAAKRRPDPQVRLVSLEKGTAQFSIDRLEPVSNWVDYVSGTIWAANVRLESGFDAVLGTEIPVGAGLSSSAALELAISRLIHELTGAEWDAVKAAMAAHRAENDFVGMPCGVMDQLVVAISQGARATLIDCRSLQTSLVPIPHTVTITVMDTGTRRQHTKSGYAERRRSCERISTRLGIRALRDATAEMLTELPASDYRRAHHVISENQRTRDMADLLALDQINAAGITMRESHQSLRDDFEVSCPELDLIVEIASNQRGCFGARMTGGGFAGCAVALVDSEELPGFNGAVSDQYTEATGRRAQIYSTRGAQGVSLA